MYFVKNTKSSEKSKYIWLDEGRTLVEFGWNDSH